MGDSSALPSQTATDDCADEKVSEITTIIVKGGGALGRRITFVAINMIFFFGLLVMARSTSTGWSQSVAAL